MEIKTGLEYITLFVVIFKTGLEYTTLFVVIFSTTAYPPLLKLADCFFRFLLL
jgi:hypothetical protein